MARAELPTLDIKEIPIRLRQMCLSYGISNLEILSEERLGYILVTLIRNIQTVHGTKSISYPVDWWQAVKDKFAPDWFKKKYPVLRDSWHAEALFPESKEELDRIASRLGYYTMLLYKD